MMESRKCQVTFDASLSEEDVDLRINAIRLLKGVHHVSTEQTSTKVPRRDEEAGPEQAASQAASQAANPMGSRPPSREGGDIWETEQDVSPQRMAIDRAIKWGVQTKIVSLQQIQALDSSQLVQLAMQLLEKMPEEEKVSLGADISNLML